MRRRNGFTLVELLVVIGVVTVLISLLMPVLVMARDAANRIACASNLKQLALAARMYLNDNHDTFYRSYAGTQDYVGVNYHYSQGNVRDTPPVAQTMTGPSGGSTPIYDFFHFYATYLAGKPNLPDTGSPSITNDIRFFTAKVFVCPSNPRDPNLFTSGYNYAICASSCTDFTLKAYTLAKAAIDYEGYMPYGPALFSDVCVYPGNPPGGLYPSYTNHWKNGPWNNGIGRPAGGNVAHLDGSVAWYDYTGLGSITPATAPCFVGPNGGTSGVNNYMWPCSELLILKDNDGYIKSFDGYYGANPGSVNHWNCWFGKNNLTVSQVIP